MTHSSHVSLSLNALFLVVILTCNVFGVFFRAELFSPVLVGVVFGSLLPDIDEPESFIGKRMLPLSAIVSFLFRHRGASHYLLTPVIIFTVAIFTSGVVSLFLVGVAFGYFFHLIGDMMTLGGIKGFLFPFGSRTKTYAIMPKGLRFKTNSIQEKIIAGLLGILFFYQIFIIYTSGVIA